MPLVVAVVVGVDENNFVREFDDVVIELVMVVVVVDPFVDEIDADFDLRGEF